MNPLEKAYGLLFADLYAVLLKTQNYHWHVIGPHFKPLHMLFEEQYQQLFDLIDEVAERMVTLNFVVPATMTQIKELAKIKDGNHKLTSQEMVMDLSTDYDMLMENLYEVLDQAKKIDDEGSMTFVTDLIVKLEKTAWMLRASSGGY